MLQGSVESALPGEGSVKHGIFVIDVCSPTQRCLLYCLSHSNEILECFSKMYTKFQINTLSAKKVADIYSDAGVSIFTYITNCQPWVLVSAKIPWSVMC